MATGILPSILLIWYVLLIHKLLFLSGFSFWLCAGWTVLYTKIYFNIGWFELLTLHYLYAVCSVYTYGDIIPVKQQIWTQVQNMFSKIFFVISNKQGIFSSCWLVYLFSFGLKFERDVWLIGYFQNTVNLRFPVATMNLRYNPIFSNFSNNYIDLSFRSS